MYSILYSCLENDLVLHFPARVIDSIRHFHDPAPGSRPDDVTADTTVLRSTHILASNNIG